MAVNNPQLVGGLESVLGSSPTCLSCSSEIHCWQLSKQMSRAGWTLGPNPHCCVLCSCLLQNPFSAIRPTTLSTSPSSPPLSCLGKSLWRKCSKYIFHHPLLTLSSAVHSLRRHCTVPWDLLSQISSTCSSELVLLTST